MDSTIVIHHIVMQPVAASSVHTNPDITVTAQDEAHARAALDDKSKAAVATLAQFGLPESAIRTEEPVGGDAGANSPPEARMRMTKGWYFDLPFASAPTVIDSLFEQGFEFNNLIELRADAGVLAQTHAGLRQRYEDEAKRIIALYATAISVPYSPDKLEYELNQLEDNYSGQASLAEFPARNIARTTGYIGGTAKLPFTSTGEAAAAKEITINYLASAPQDWREYSAGITLRGLKLENLMDELSANSEAAAEALLALDITREDILFQAVRNTQTRPDPVFPEGATSVPTPAPDGFEVSRDLRIRLRDAGKSDRVSAALEKIGVTNGFLVMPGSDDPRAIRDAARAEAIGLMHKKIKGGAVIGIEEQNFFDVVYEQQDKDSTGTPLDGRAVAGVSLKVRYLPAAK